MRLPHPIARHLSAVALSAAVAAAGCAGQSAQRLRVGTARLDTLVELHPAYRSIAGLGRWSSDMRHAAAVPPAALAAPQAHAFAPQPGGELPRPHQAPAVLAHAQGVVEQELTRLAQSMEQRDQQRLALRAREAEREAEAQNAQRRTELEREMESDRRRILLASRAETFDLGLNADNLERTLQQPHLGPLERAHTQERLQAARQKLAQALESRGRELEAAAHRYQEQLAALRKAAAEQVAHQVEALRAPLGAEREKELAAERVRLQSPLVAAAEQEPAPKLPPAPPVHAAPGPLAKDFAAASGSLRAEARRWSRAMTEGSRMVARRRDELAGFIRWDTRRTAEALGRAHGWRIKWAPPGASRGERDITARAEEWLREYWGAAARPRR